MTVISRRKDKHVGLWKCYLHREERGPFSLEVASFEVADAAAALQHYIRPFDDIVQDKSIVDSIGFPLSIYINSKLSARAR